MALIGLWSDMESENLCKFKFNLSRWCGKTLNNAKKINTQFHLNHILTQNDIVVTAVVVWQNNFTQSEERSRIKKQHSKNYFNLTSDNPEILIIQRWRTVVPRRHFPFYQKTTSSIKKGDLWDLVKEDSKSICTSAAVVSWPYILLQNLQLWRHQKTHKRTMMAQNQQTTEISKWDTPLIGCTAQV